MLPAAQKYHTDFCLLMVQKKIIHIFVYTISGCLSTNLTGEAENVFT